MNSNDFVIENGILKAYLGSPNISGDFVIPEGVTIIGDKIFQENINGKLNIVYPSTYKSYEGNPFDKSTVSGYDFSKCNLTNLSLVPLCRHVDTLVLPNTIKTIGLKFEEGKFFTCQRMFISLGGVIAPQPFDFATCSNLTQIDFNDIINQTFVVENIILPSSVIEFDQANLSAKNITFAENSKVQKLILTSKFQKLVVPPSVKELTLTAKCGNFIVPKVLKNSNRQNLISCFWKAHCLTLKNMMSASLMS